MLSYLGLGERRYCEKPIRVNQRHDWEFQAVLRGSIAPVFENGPGILQRRRMWLFPPTHRHGWLGEKEGKAEIVVFHFHSVPEPLARLVRHSGHLEIPIDETICSRLRQLARHSWRYWKDPAPGMILCHEHALMELSLLAYEAASVRPGGGPDGPAREKIKVSLQWFAAHMQENPGMDRVSQVAGTSVSHLRRLFHEVLQASPKHVLDQLRFQRATQLMADPNVKLAEVSDTCGFGSPSAFSRAFKTKFGCSPETWRG